MSWVGSEHGPWLGDRGGKESSLNIVEKWDVGGHTLEQTCQRLPRHLQGLGCYPRDAGEWGRTRTNADRLLHLLQLCLIH